MVDNTGVGKDVTLMVGQRYMQLDRGHVVVPGENDVVYVSPLPVRDLDQPFHVVADSGFVRPPEEREWSLYKK